MRYLFGFICLLALGFMGCSETAGTGGGGGDGGQGGDGGTGGNGVACVDNVCPCNEAGIRAAIAEGGGPFTFSCDGPTTVVTEAEIVIDNDVILDGEGNLTVEMAQGSECRNLFLVRESVFAELQGLELGGLDSYRCLVLFNEGTLSLSNIAVLGSIYNQRTMTVRGCTLSTSGIDTAIYNEASSVTRIANSTVSSIEPDEIAKAGGDNAAILTDGFLTITNSTVWWSGQFVLRGEDAVVTVANSLINTTCEPFNDPGPYASHGYNIESPGDTCGFDQPTDQVGVDAEDLKLGELADNGGPTETHALLPGSVAIDAIPTGPNCNSGLLTRDQRGQPRPETGGTDCDVGAFEVQP